MGWSHPEIPLEDLLKLIKGFIDIMILGSGYQSSGSIATWDSHNIQKCIQWGIFYENVFKGLESTDDYTGSVRELDAALLEMTSNPYFPQGIRHLSSATLMKGRDLIMRLLIQTLPLRDVHFTALLTATVELELDNLKRAEYDFLNVYFEKLLLHSTYYNTRAPQSVSNVKVQRNCSNDPSEFVIQEILERENSVSRVLSVETGLTILSKSLTCGELVGKESTLLEMQSQDGTSLVSKEQLAEFELWNKWRSRGLSYLLDERTIKLVSGAKLIFSSPEVQWIQVFERLDTSNGDELLEIIELCLLGYISSSWNHLIEHVMSVSYDICSKSINYHEMFNLLQERSQFPHSKEETRNSKENDILEYLAVLMRSQSHAFWKLSPILPAIAIPIWSPLFKLYLTGIGAMFKGNLYKTRCCSCTREVKEHEDCDLAERIWCLVVFNIHGSHQRAITSCNLDSLG
ncbi:uncharacterized protein LOC113319120 [Papaver somniferum]|uniref:uncharacterized protein LOC113319120 n=1 Tax=Papaver somniferum TaxID=3469 RepID=UPI000E700DC0|nr:uncharacterized protein LOC113319120 [Papaver somniferum]